MGYLRCSCIIIGILLDQFTKQFANNTLTFYQPVEIIPSVLNFHLVYNSGAAYGLFHNQRFFLLSVSLVIIMGLVFFWHYFTKNMKFAMSWVLIGALGNFIDRFYYGYVIDFIDIGIIPVFNIADICINIGILFYIKEVLEEEFFSHKLKDVAS